MISTPSPVRYEWCFSVHLEPIPAHNIEKMNAHCFLCRCPSEEDSSLDSSCCLEPNSILIPLVVPVSQHTNLLSPLHQHPSPRPNLVSDPKTCTLQTQDNQKSALCGIAPQYLKGIDRLSLGNQMLPISRNHLGAELVGLSKEVEQGSL